MILAWSIELSRPMMLVLLVSLLPVAWYFHRSLVDFTLPQRWASLASRVVVLVLLTLAAAGLNLVRGDDRQFVVFLVDRSDSIDAEASKSANAFIDETLKVIGGGDDAGVIEFGGNASAMLSSGQWHELQADGDLQASTAPSDNTSTTGSPQPFELDKSKTDLANAISIGWASIPAFYAKTLVLVSDGRATRGDAVQMAQTAREAGVRICTKPLRSSTRDEVQLSAVSGPAQVRTGAPFKLQIDITSNHEDTAELEIYRNDIKVGSKSVELKAGRNAFEMPQVASADKFQTYSVQLKAKQDHFLDNNVASTLIACEGKPRVLIIGPEDRIGTLRSQEPYLVRALEREDIRVEERGPRGVPRSLGEIENYDLLILSDVPAHDLDQHQMQIVRTYVQDLGGGFIMLGGEQSFGLGGYYKTVLEEILPVRSDFEKEKQKPHLAMVLVVDKSGSMGGIKIELAKEAAKGAVELLGPKDQVGVIAFDGASSWVSEIHPATDRMFIIDRISSLTAGGGTNLAPALSDAFLALDGTTAPLKHVIAMTDGHSQPGNFYDIASNMASAGITVSTVAVGSGADKELLERIAQWGNGRSYFTEDPQSIPQIFARETMEASKSAISEQPFLPQQVRPHQVLEGVNLDEAQFLLGYVITKAKPTAELVLATEAGHPLLATWRYGLGKSLAWTSDAKNRWAAEWLQWPGFSRFWSQVVRDTMRSTAPSTMHVEMERSGGTVDVTIDALHPSPERAGEFLNDVTTTLELLRPGRAGQEIDLDQIAPGRYVGSFNVEDVGNYHVRIAQKQGDVEIQSTSLGTAVGYSDEYRVGSTDEALLERLAEIGGGTHNPSAEAVLADEARSIRVQPLWPILLSAALILLILDVALRRIDFSLVFGRARAWPQPVSR